MGKTVSIRNVPEKVHRVLKARAAQAGMSLSDFLVRELKKSADLPDANNMWERFASLSRIDLGGAGADLVRGARKEREHQMNERNVDEALISRR